MTDQTNTPTTTTTLEEELQKYEQLKKKMAKYEEMKKKMAAQSKRVAELKKQERTMVQVYECFEYQETEEGYTDAPTDENPATTQRSKTADTRLVLTKRGFVDYVKHKLTKDKLAELCYDAALARRERYLVVKAKDIIDKRKKKPTATETTETTEATEATEATAAPE
jgi:hypothetical protein